MTRIKELKSGEKSLVVEGFIVEKADERTVAGRYDGNEYRVCNFLLSETKKATKDNSITLVLWEGDIDRVRVGDEVRIENGYTTTFNNVVQLNVGKYGQLKVVK